MDEFIERVASLLESLGDTADEVAESLRIDEIKGVPRAGDCCPVANYLGKVGIAARVTATCFGTPYESLAPLPDAVVEFVRRFDLLDYPDLITD